MSVMHTVPTRKSAHVRMRSRPSQYMGLVGKQVRIETLHKVAQRWHGIVVLD